MSKNSIRLGSKTAVTIEVNDNGDTIRLDMSDPKFLQKAQNMMRKVSQFNEDLKSNSDFEKLVSFMNDDNITAENLLSEEAFLFGDVASDYYENGKEAIDEFLGKGASEKIFYDGDYLGMFDDLFESLEEYFEKAAKLQGVQQKRIDELREKYGSKGEEEIVI